MGAVRDDIIARVWRGQDPFTGFPKDLYQHDLQGWKFDHPYLGEAMDALRPAVVVEVGVWKGASTIAMAQRLKALGLDAAVIAVDTWLGSSDHWTIFPEWFEHLGMMQGQAMLIRKFMGNVAAADLTDVIVPLPLDSLNASYVLDHFGVRPNVVHLDGGHDYGTVLADLKHWWPLLAEDGLLIGDDYTHNGAWPGVRQAFDEFFADRGQVEHVRGKCRVYKDPARVP